MGRAGAVYSPCRGMATAPRLVADTLLLEWRDGFVCETFAPSPPGREAG
jgi:hypothetical protein